MARSLCRRECFRHLSCYEMATLAAHDPGHGAHSQSWMKTRLFSWLQRALFFFPRVRTPCGHGAQVIIEGREEKTDG